MKQMLLMLLASLWLFTACGTRSEGLVNIPAVIGSQTVEDATTAPVIPPAAGENGHSDEPPEPYPAATPVNGMRVTPATATRLGEPYPFTGDTEGSDGLEIATAPVTVLPEPYPLGEPTKEARPTGQPSSTPQVEATPTAESSNPVTYGYRVINEYPHDRESFTQGLLFDREPGIVLEGSGLWGQSSLRRADLQSGSILQFLALPDEYFGEGITAVGDRIYQLTWKSGTGFIYDRETFELLDTFTYDHEGWGITHDGERLIVSDGTDTIRFWHPETLAPLGQIQVYDQSGPVTRLNELEFVEGEIFANIWLTDTIVRIDPQTGQVVGTIDLTGLLAEADRIGTENVLNGIAYDAQTGRLLVTGKRWPKLYEIELVAQDGAG